MNKLKDFFKTNKAIIVPTVVMVCICIVVTGALAATNLITKENIKAQEIKQQQDSMKEVMKAASYDEKTSKLDNEDFTYYVAKDSGKTIGYIFITSEKGYGGDDKVMTAIETNGKIKAVKVLDVSNETPGLGQNTGSPDWYAQFSGLDGTKDVNVLKNSADKEKNEINAVTGATISSTAVKNAVNKAINQYKLIGEESAENE